MRLNKIYGILCFILVVFTLKKQNVRYVVREREFE